MLMLGLTELRCRSDTAAERRSLLASDVSFAHGCARSPPRDDTPRGTHPVITLAGILLPSSVLHSHWFQALAAFVAINTLIYAALSLAKLIPRKRA